MKHKIARFLKWFSVFLAFYVTSLFGLTNFTPLRHYFPPASEFIIRIWETTPYEDMWEGYEHLDPKEWREIAPGLWERPFRYNTW